MPKCRGMRRLFAFALVSPLGDGIVVRKTEILRKVPSPIACDGEGAPAKRRAGEARLLAILHLRRLMRRQKGLAAQCTTATLPLYLVPSGKPN